jgi:hypothetical protein
VLLLNDIQGFDPYSFSHFASIFDNLQEVVHLSLCKATCNGIDCLPLLGWENFFSLRIFSVKQEFCPQLIIVGVICLVIGLSIIGGFNNYLCSSTS